MSFEPKYKLDKYFDDLIYPINEGDTSYREDLAREIHRAYAEIERLRNLDVATAIKFRDLAIDFHKLRQTLEFYAEKNNYINDLKVGTIVGIVTLTGISQLISAGIYILDPAHMRS